MGNNFVGVIIFVVAIGLIIVFFKYFLIIIAVAVFLIILLSMMKKIKKKQESEEIVADNITRGQIDVYIKESIKKVQELRKYYYKLKGDEMRNTLDEVTAGLKKIINILKENPNNFKKIRRFLNTTLTSCDNILFQSSQLFSIENPSEKNKQALENAKEGLVLLSTAMKNQINKLYDSNVLDLDVEIEVLKNILGAKGLLEKENNDE